MSDDNNSSNPELTTLTAGLTRGALKKIAQGMNSTEEGKTASGKKYWTQALVFQAMCAYVDAGNTAEETVAHYTEIAETNSAERAAADGKTEGVVAGPVAALYERVS